jgi:hypothetical protein
MIQVGDVVIIGAKVVLSSVYLGPIRSVSHQKGLSRRKWYDTSLRSAFGTGAAISPVL